MNVKLLLAACVIAISVTGCGETNLVRDVAQGTGLAGRPSEPAQFVRETRASAPTGYLAVGVSAPPRPAPRLTAEQFRAMEASLDADRARLEAEGAAARRAGAATSAPRPPSAQ